LWIIQGILTIRAAAVLICAQRRCGEVNILHLQYIDVVSQ
jgi:hypothetical protein